MSDDLELRIREAEAAAEELARLERLRAELPALQAEQARRQRAERATMGLIAAEDQARQKLAHYRDRVTVFQSAFGDWVTEGRRLAALLAELQGGIPEVAARLNSAIVEATRAEVGAQHPARAWHDLGWTDGALQAVPGGSGFDAQLGQALAKEADTRVYLPSEGIRSAGVKA